MEETPFSAVRCGSLSEFLKKAGDLIQQKIALHLPDREPREYLYDLLKDYPSRGGKKFRPALVLLSCELFGTPSSHALISATAFELFQNFALIHDDIEDGSLVRRGLPTLHRLHGIPLALNAGDCMFGLVYEMLLSNASVLGAELSSRIMRYFNEVFRYTFEGQAIDIGWSAYDVLPTREEYQMMISRKTGWYSGKGPCQCGAMISGANDSQLALIGRLGEAIGIGFQARDDVLNLVTASETTAPSAISGGYGKERGGDIAEGKRTLITIEMFERLSEKDRHRFHKILLKSREQTTEKEIEWSIAQAEQSGAIDAVIAYCEGQAAIAKECLKELPSGAPRRFLEELVNYLTIQRYA